MIFVKAISSYEITLPFESVVVFISVVQKDSKASRTSHMPLFISLIISLPSFGIFFILTLLASFAGLFIAGGLKKYKSKIIACLMDFCNDSGHDIDKMTSLSVILNKHRGIGMSFKSGISSSKYLRFLLVAVVKSSIDLGSQLLLLVSMH